MGDTENLSSLVSQVRISDLGYLLEGVDGHGGRIENVQREVRKADLTAQQ